MTRYLPTPPIFVHAMLTFIMGWWCFILMHPGSTFDTSPAYAGFRALGTEEQWAAGAGIVCLCGLAGLRWFRFREYSEHVLAIAHGIIAITVVTTVPLNTATGVYTVLMVAAWYLIAWGRRDA